MSRTVAKNTKAQKSWLKPHRLRRAVQITFLGVCLSIGWRFVQCYLSSLKSGTNGVYYDLAPIGITYAIDPNTYALNVTMVNNTLNYFGLPFQSVNLAYQFTDANGNPTGNL